MSAAERAGQIAERIGLSEKVSRQLTQNPKGARQPGQSEDGRADAKY